MEFTHPAQKLTNTKPLVYTAMSKQLFYFRLHIQKFVLEQQAVPLNPFTSFDYFLLDTVERDLVREANNSLVARSDEIWVFGPISNGVLAEVQQAKNLSKPVRYFAIQNSKTIVETTKSEAELEEEVKDYRHLL